MNKNIDEKEETKVTKQEEYNQILELFGEKAEEMTEEEKKKGLSRRRLREEAFKILFSMQFIKVDEQKVEIYCDINGIGNKEDIAYLVNIVDVYNENNKYLESIIEENKKDTWDYSRLDKIAITLIKLAIIEIEY